MKRILYIVIGISLTACLTEVDLSDLRESPRLVVNGVAVAGEPLRLSVTRTWFYTDDHPNVVIPDATVRLYVNDHYEETIPFVPGDTLFNAAGSYQAAFVPKMADRLRLEVSAPGYEAIHAETVIPQASQLLEAKAVREVSTSDSTVKRVVYSISFQDAVEEENYYLFRLEEGNLINEEEATYSWRVLYLDYAEEPFLCKLLPLWIKFFLRSIYQVMMDGCSPMRPSMVRAIRFVCKQVLTMSVRPPSGCVYVSMRSLPTIIGI